MMHPRLDKEIHEASHNESHIEGVCNRNKEVPPQPSGTYDSEGAVGQASRYHKPRQRRNDNEKPDEGAR